MSDSIRNWILGRVAKLSLPQLERVAQLLDQLEAGDSSPATAPSPIITSLPIQQQTAHYADIVKAQHTPDLASDWAHAPLHQISEYGTYMVTAATYHKAHVFARPDQLDLLESALLRVTQDAGWQLEAWAVFSNHYHFIGHRLAGGDRLDALIKQLHGETGHDVNEMDGETDREVWFNYWDKRLTFRKSYFPRLKYVHQNAVKHRLVPVASQYKWCSAAWFERTAKRAQVKTIYSFKTDKLNIVDDYDPIVDGDAVNGG